MEAIKTLVFVSPKLTKRKLSEIYELTSNFKKLTNFFLKICIKHGISSKAKLHSLSYHLSKTVVPQNEIHSKYRYKALSLADSYQDIVLFLQYLLVYLSHTDKINYVANFEGDEFYIFLTWDIR